MDFANGLFLKHSILLIFSIYLCAIFKKTDGKTQQSQITLWVGRELKKKISQDIRHRHKEEQRRSISKEVWEAQSG